MGELAIQKRQLTHRAGRAWSGVADVAERSLLWMYPGVLVIIELAIATGSPGSALLLCGAMMLGLALHRAWSPSPAAQRLLLALQLAPLLRFVSLTLPLRQFPALVWPILAALPVLLAAWSVTHRLGLSPGEVGIRRGSPLLVLLLVLSGCGIGLLADVPSPLALALAPAPELAPWSVLAVAGCAIFLSSAVEELVFRGLIANTAFASLGPLAPLYSALVSGVLLLGYRSPMVVCIAVCVGLVYAYVVRWGGSVIGVALGHGCSSFVALIGVPWLKRATGAHSELWAAVGGCTGLCLLAIVLLLLRYRSSADDDQHDRAAAGPGLAQRAERRAAGLTLSDLAMRSGISSRTLAEIESGRRLASPREAEQIMGALRNPPAPPQRTIYTSANGGHAHDA